MKHVAQGRIDRYVNRAISLYGAPRFFEWAATQPPVLGRRAMLKALRDYMSPKRNHKQRHYRRGRESWMVPADQYPGKSEAFNVFMAQKLGIEVTP